VHAKNGVFGSTINLFLDIPSKMKDGLNTHKDLQTLGIREELHPQERPNRKVYLPITSYTLTTEEKREYVTVCAELKSPQDSHQHVKNLVSPCQM
jgi:hypothetical protein